MKSAGIILVVALLGAGLWLYLRRPDPPEAPAARVTRSSLVQLVTTNGKVEALDTVEVRARASVAVTAVRVHEGDQVRQGQLLADVDATAARQALEHARSQLEVVRADRALIERGGTAAEIAQLNSAIAASRMEKETAEQQIASLQRLVERSAAPRVELQEMQQRRIKADMELASLERKRASFIGPEDRDRVQARIREAETAVAQAEASLSIMELRAPAGGVLYMLDLHSGGYYTPGALVGRIGLLDKVRVRLLVDEPELGAVQIGQPVRITWDALAGAEWNGTVERLASSIQTVGTRSVGELLCTIDTRDRRLLPNVTVNVAIRTASVENSLTIPREAVVREGEKTLVLLADSNGAISRQPVRLGIHDLARVQVTEGLTENQVVILPGERSFTPGEIVRPKLTS